ncbi:adipocyte plasma membrane-associated protein-like [Oppia nitens]|uniref:adipocyte plasma membrane-associated protein-like n=1 Tax=Oppia nitens TaxID=1686743 RepID=UPI0023DB10F5|nr:adipocyte plasma membrane-associated protein-like [Oppia nitens]
MDTPYMVSESQYLPAIVPPTRGLPKKYSKTSLSSAISPVAMPYEQQLVSYPSIPQSNSYSDNTYTSSETTEPLSYRFSLPKSFVGPLEPNNLLSQATRLFEGQILGPTSLAIHRDFIYAGTAGGGVFRGNLRTGNSTRIAKIANEFCDNKPWDSSVCGRPLGVRVDSTGTLYFVDAYLGLHVIEFVDNQVKLNRLLSLEQVGGKYMGHLVIDEGAGSAGGHVVYVTIASSKRDLMQWTAMIIEPDTSGFVVKYDTDTGNYEIIWSNLWYPASIEITDDRMGLLVAEFTTRRVLKHYIKGAKKGTTEVWAENLPGEADHLIRSLDKTRETYWMPIINARNESATNLLDWMSDKPYLRQEILEKYSKLGSSVEEMGQQYKNEMLEKLGFTIKSAQQFYTQNIQNNYGMILELDANGNIIGSLHSQNGVNSFISEAIEGYSDTPDERVLYIGSFGYPYILKLVVKKPIYDLPVFNTLRGEESAYDLDPKQGVQYTAYTKPYTFDDELKFVDIPTLLKSWPTLQTTEIKTNN